MHNTEPFLCRGGREVACDLVEQGVGYSERVVTRDVPGRSAPRIGAQMNCLIQSLRRSPKPVISASKTRVGTGATATAVHARNVG